MAKPKSPLLSLGAHGTVGDALTYQKRGTEHIVREKPIPKDPYSLAQAYQRWDYRDYAYLWTLLSNAEKQVYRTKASRYHITGFSQFMRESLKDLADIAGRWHLDELGGAIAYDSSKNDNNGTIIGATPATGLIAGAYYFDGINDRIIIPHDASLNMPDDFTIYLRLKTSFRPAHDWWDIFTKRGVAVNNYDIWMFTDGTLRAELYDGVNNPSCVGPVIDDGLWHDVAFVRRTATGNIELYVDDLAPVIAADTTTLSIINTTDVHLAEILGLWYKGYLDDAILKDRACDQTEITRHLKRRYPL